MKATKIKEDVIKMIKKMPENIDVADIMAELFFRHKVEIGLKELDSGKGVSHKQAQKRLRRWLG